MNEDSEKTRTKRQLREMCDALVDGFDAMYDEGLDPGGYRAAGAFLLNGHTWHLDFVVDDLLADLTRLGQELHRNYKRRTSHLLLLHCRPRRRH